MVTLPAVSTVSCRIRQILSNSSVVGCAGGVVVYTVCGVRLLKALWGRSWL